MATLVLDARSIVESLSSVGVDITVDDIIHPVASRIQSIYFGFCTKVLGVPEKSLSELPFECQLNPETAEMHQKSTPLLLLFTTMQCFIIDFGETNADFTMCDLINPTPKRTRKLLSLLADYTNFHRMASKVFEKTSGEYDEARQVIEEAQEQVRLAENRKHTLRSEQDTRKRKENELLAEFNHKNVIFNELVKGSEANESRRDAVLKAINDGKQRIISCREEVRALQREIEHLSKGVLRSPRRIQREVDSLRDMSKQLRESCDAERQRIHDNADSILTIEKASKLLDERFTELERLREAVAHINIVEHDAVQARAQVNEATKKKLQSEEALSRLVESCESEATNFIRASELCASRLQELKTRKEELVRTVNDLRSKAPSVQSEMSLLQNEIVRLRNEKSAYTKQAHTFRIELEKRFNDLLEKYARDEELFNQQLNSFSQAIRSTATALDEAEAAVIAAAGDMHPSN